MYAADISRSYRGTWRRGCGMPASGWDAADFDLGLGEALSCAREVFDKLGRAASWMSAGSGRSEGEGGPNWHWKSDGPKGRMRGGFAGPKGPGHWGGGFGGTWGGWWPGAPGAPGPSRGTKAGRGDVRAAILALLLEGPRTGYQIMSDIEERSGGAWRPSPGAVYPALSQLADEGLIVGEETGGRRTFRLTEAGREHVEQNPRAARGAWESQAQQEAWQLPGLFAEAARLGSGIVQIAHAGTPAQVEAAERLLEQTRRKLYQILAEDDGEDDDDAGDDAADAQDEI
jgi:DNA-binding PadR family transcriptional regulator